MDPELRDLLRSVSGDSASENYSHVTLYPPPSRWTIRHEGQTTLWTGYCDLVSRKGEDAALCLAERVTGVAPLMAHLTFRFQVDSHDEGEWEPYDDRFLQQLCAAYQTVLGAQFNVNTEARMELVVLVLESSTHWYEDGPEGSGSRYLVLEIRLQFPYGRVDIGLQGRVVRPQVIQELRRRNLLGSLERQPVGDWDQIISTDFTAPVPLYGSHTVPNRPKLHLTHIWPQIVTEDIEEGVDPEEIPLADAFIPVNHILVQQQVVNPEIFTTHSLEHWLPLFLSMGYWPTVLLPRSESITGPVTPRTVRPFGEGNREWNEQGELEVAEQMLGLLGPQRFQQETFWLDIGKGLYAATSGSEDGLLTWIRHSERACRAVTPPFMQPSIAEACRDLYSTFGTSYVTVKTLAWYAREDAPERYASWHREWCLASMEQALSCLHTDVALVLYRVYWLDFLYCPAAGRGKWFQFRNHRWNEVHQGLEIRKAMSRDFMKRFEAARALLSRQIHDSSDEGFRSKGEITLKKLSQLIGRLKTVAFKSNIMTEAAEHFANDRFISLLDTNPDITGLTNGVLEILGDFVVYRAAKPEDYVSMCANIPYHATYSWKHPLVMEVMKWMGQVFTDKQLLHHFLKFGASCLRGRNGDKIFPIWTGEGDNSKSMVVKLFESTFGSYSIKFPIAMLCEKVFNSSGPTPQLARAKSTRVAFLDEPEDDVPMQKGVIKRYTGGDSFFARLLQENGGDVQATFKLVLMCNKVPIVPNADKAIKNRTRLFPFMSTWVKDAPKEEEEQYHQRRFPMNTAFDKRIPILAPAFLWVLSQYYPYYASEGLADPPIVTAATEAYWQDNDVYAQFAADRIQEVLTATGERDVSVRLSLSEVYTEFKIWFREAFPGTKVPERTAVRGELSVRWGKMSGVSWPGLRIADMGAPPADLTSGLQARLGAKGTFLLNEGRAPNTAPPVASPPRQPADRVPTPVRQSIPI